MMETRERGWQAFQEGRTDEAIELLRQACVEDPGDYQAHCYLGAVYGKADRHDESIQTLTTAVHLQPANAQARFNLGVALEKAGFTPQAIEAYRQALTLDPNYFKARAAIERLDEPPAEYSNSPDIGGATGNLAIEERIAAPSMSVSDPNRAVGATAPAYTESPSSQSLHEEPPGFSSATAAQASALPSYGLLSNYTPSPHAPAGPTAILEPYSPELPPPNYNDEIDIPQTIRDFGRILVMPDRFFREQSGRNGLMSPIVMVGVYLVLQFLTILINSGAQSVTGLIASVALSPFSLAIAGAQMLMLYLISALVVHFVGWIFGNRQDYSVSVRACIYADAPRFLLSLILSCYLASFVFPAYNAHPITSAEIEQVLGVPIGTMGGGTTAFTTSGPVVIKHGKRTAATTGPVVITHGKQTAPTVSTAKTGGARAAAPQFTPELVTRAIGLFWKRFGAMMLVCISFSVVGWLWSSVLLALAIHRLQRIPPVRAAGVVIAMYGLGLLLLLLLLFALKGPIMGVLHWFLTMAPGAAAAGRGR